VAVISRHLQIEAIRRYDGINDKHALSLRIEAAFGLTHDRSVFCCQDFAVRFCKARAVPFGNTVLSLSALKHYDDRPFIVCVVTPQKNHLLLANTTFLKRISHSSHKLTIDTIRGSFNGSDILLEYEGFDNVAENFAQLYAIHEAIGFEQNLARLVEATGDIVATGRPFAIDERAQRIIFEAPLRASAFYASSEYSLLRESLDEVVRRETPSIVLASSIENVNIRGRVIEYLVSGENSELKEAIRKSLRHRHNLPQFSTDNRLSDYTKTFSNFHTETDVKSKIMSLASNPKGYNIDKLLEFLSSEGSVFFCYFIGIDGGDEIHTALVSPFDIRLLKGTSLITHWAGRSSRGVSQFNGQVIKDLILSPNNKIDLALSDQHIRAMIDA